MRTVLQVGEEPNYDLYGNSEEVREEVKYRDITHMNTLVHKLLIYLCKER